MSSTSLTLRLALWFALAPQLPAQLSDYELVNPSIAHRPEGITTADLDQDGRIDVVTCSSPDRRVVLYHGLGLGRFAPGVEVYRATEDVHAVVADDFSGDGISDLIVGLSYSIIYIQGLGGGEFAAPQSIAGSPPGAFELRAVDLEGDQDIDVIVGTYDRVAVLENQGAANFGPWRDVYSAGAFYVIDFDHGDLDGDGLVDVLVVSEDGYPFVGGEFAVMLQLPGGSFAPPQILGPPTLTPTAAVILDMDVDGLPDVVWGDRFSGDLTWHRNLGAGQFSATGAVFASLRSIKALLAIDLDADGDQDLLYTRNGAYSPMERIVGELLNQGGGAFATGQIIDDTRYNPGLLETADLNQDGVLDVLTATQHEEVLWYPRFVPGYGQGNELTERVSYEGLVLSDVDLDGRTDVVIADETVRWFQQRPDGTFARALEVPFDGITLDMHEMEDLDGDGDADLALVSWTATDQLFWLPAGPTGLGAPQTIAILPPGMNFQSPYALDIDLDGDVDLFSAAGGTGQVSYFENLGGAVFAPRVDIDTIETPFAQPPVDLNGDGLLDLVVVSITAQGEPLYVWENLGAGQFASRRLVGTEPGPTLQILPMDLDADGDADLLRLDRLSSGGHIQWYENLGGFAFAPPQLVRQSPFGNWFELRAHDWDLDGREDLMIMDRVLRHVEWSRNEGQGMLAPPVVLADGMRDGTLFRLGDLDGDLDSDLVVLDSQLRGIRMFTNLGTLGAAYCTSTHNSTGAAAELEVTGSSTAMVNRVSLRASSLPAGVPGYFLTSMTQGQVAQPGGSQGVLCLRGMIGRFNRPGEVQTSDPTGRLGLELDLAQIPTPSGVTSVLAGQTWSYQCWFRDVNPAATSNFSSGVAVTYQ